MPKLPSGVEVGIMYERARYHAIRRQLTITEQTPHQQLYPLIDIIFAESDDSSSRLPMRYTFTGHTLDDNDWLNKWLPEDRRCFLEWIETGEQVRKIEMARRRLTAEPGGVLPEVKNLDYGEEFYSELYRRIHNLSMRKATPDHWLRTLKRLQGQGVGQEELQWSGLNEYLQEQIQLDKEQIYRDELASRIDFKRIRPQLSYEWRQLREPELEWEEIAIKLSPLQLTAMGLPAGRYGVLRYKSLQAHYQIGHIHPEDQPIASAPYWFILDGEGDLISDDHGFLYMDRGAAFASVQRHAAIHLKSGALPTKSIGQYDYVALHGGEDYREWLVTLPEYSLSHFTGHYLERNLLMHMRTKIREDSSGRSLLFIEEMQSDWHQHGARYGYGNRMHGRIPVAPFRKEWVALGLKMLLSHIVNEGLDGLAWTSGAQQNQRYGKELSPIYRLYDETIPGYLQRLGRGWQVTTATTLILTLDPWLQAWRKGDRWYVKSADGRLQSRPRFDRLEAQKLIARHSRSVDLEVPVFIPSEGMRQQILEDGLPLFGCHFHPLR